MNVKRTSSVDFSVRTLDQTERQKVFALFDCLKNWENDPHIQKISKPSIYKNVYVLTNSDDLRISFSLDREKNEITILDITKPSRFATASQASE